MGWIGQIDTMEELEALMCDNVLPRNDMPEAFYACETILAPNARRLIKYQCKIYGLRRC